MKHFAAAALALSLLAGTSAFAEPPQSGAHPAGGKPGGAPTGGHPGGGAPTGGQHPGGGAPTGGQHPGGGGPTGGQRPGGGAPTGGQRTTGGPTGAAPTYTPGRHGPTGGGGGGGAPTGGQRPGGGRPGFTPPHNGGQRVTYNVRLFPRIVTPARRYNWGGPRWVGQPGYYNHRWGYGERLPFGWFVADFFINDYWDYGLGDPPWGYEWVRVGPDALLVDVNTGMVVESVYGVFY